MGRLSGSYSDLSTVMRQMLILWLTLATVGLHGVVVEGSAFPSYTWDVMVFVQGWPPSQCVSLEDEKIKCAIPDKVSSWIAHGLWPSQNGTHKPIQCNSTWKLDVHELKTLRPHLDYRWASLRVGSGVEKEDEVLWRHEWGKHGTCATTLNALKTPFLYFNATLNLVDRFNLLATLTEEGIKPDQKKTYDYKDIRAAVEKLTGVTPCLVCYQSKQKKTYLWQVEIWIDKNFQPVNCFEYNLSAPGAIALPPLSFHSELHVTYEALQALDNRSHCPPTGIFYTPVHTQPAS